VQRVLLASTRLLSALIVVLARGGGPLALGVVLGTMLAVIGALRLWSARGAEPVRAPRGDKR
jgi:hypothetical protein